MNFACRVYRAVSRRVKARWAERHDDRLGTFRPNCKERLAVRLKPLSGGLLRAREADILNLTAACLAHRFDVLGSGYVEIHHGLHCRGFEGNAYSATAVPSADPEGYWLARIINTSNLAEARKIWVLVDAAYKPIDWQLDVRSGYRWSESCWYQRIRFGHLPGVDVKVPWELARMQHLPVLALAYAAARSGSVGFTSPETYLREFRNQVLDFIATNPPRYGVNWVCPMDVAIRVVNWLLAFDLFRTHGACFDIEFEHELARSVRAHGAHIFTNLEWQPVIRGNHYLADLGGLLFAGAYLPFDGDTDAWLAYGLTELPREIDYQFQEDGTNFEASTCYHRLSAEIVAYSLAVALGLPAERLARLPSNAPGAQAGGLASGIRDPKMGCRLSAMADFLIAIAKPDGRIPQIGDNDSGRFVRLFPSISCQLNLVEDDLDLGSTVAALTGLLAEPVTEETDVPYGLESTIVRNLASGCTVGKRMDFSSGIQPEASGQYSSQRFFFDFGVYIYRQTGWYLCVRCGPNGISGHGGHGHNDKLSFELALDGANFVTDSGSYVYTARPDLRNAFRATIAHNTLVADGREQNDWPLGVAGVFRLGNRARERVIRADAHGFEGCHEGYGRPHRRKFGFTDDGPICEDWFDDENSSFIVLNLDPIVEIIKVDADNSVTLLRCGSVTMRLSLAGISEVRVDEGFISERYGVRRARQRLVCLRNAAYSRIEFCRG
jgi:hypothetical protein